MDKIEKLVRVIGNYIENPDQFDKIEKYQSKIKEQYEKNKSKGMGYGESIVQAKVKVVNEILAE